MPAPTYTSFTLSTTQSLLAQRLNDPTQTFWTPPELTLHIQNALRFWNALTGDSREWYSLPVDGTPTVWYDLQTLAGSPRISTVTDQDVYSWLQYALLEPQSPDAGLLTSQFLTADLVAAVQQARDEFLFRTGATATVRTPAVTPNSPTIVLPETVLEARRAYWLPASGGGWPIFRGDEWVTSSYTPGAPSTPGDPATFSAGTVPPLTVTLDPPPSQPGSVEFLTLESQALLTATDDTILYLPSDFAPAIYWGALAILLSGALERSDPIRAEYARARFDQHCEMLTGYPFVLGARVLSVPVQVDAVETLDTYTPEWRSVAQTLTPEVAPILAIAGQNLVAYPSAAPVNIALLLVANATLPTLPGDTIQVGREVMDAILDYAQHTAMWKCGGEEFAQTIPLLQHTVALAAKRNARVRAMSTYRDLLYGRSEREDGIQPQSRKPTGRTQREMMDEVVE